MNRYRLISLFIIFCTLISFGQNSKLHFKTNKKDSLKGFNEEHFIKSAQADNFTTDELHHFLKSQKRSFINARYNLNSTNESAENSSNNRYTSSFSSVLAAPCVNEGFESGDFTGWTLTRGTNNNSCAYPNANIPLVPGPSATVIPTPLVDPMTSFTVPNSPFGGNLVAKIGSTVTGTGKVTKMSQNFQVTNTNYLYDFAFFAVQNGVHPCCQQPYMFVRLRDCLGNLLACPNFTFNAPSGQCAASAGAWVNTGIGGPPDFIWRSNGWQTRSLDLTQYIGTCITVEVMVADCSPTGHYLYTYFDSRCNTMNLTVNNSTVLSMPTQTVTPLVLCGTTATLTAPAGLNPYLWNGPPFSGITNNTNPTISSSVAGNYSLTMTPAGICTPITRIVKLTFVPPASISVFPAGGICPGKSATLIATGATNYTWQPSGSNAIGIVVSPTATTVYTLIANTGTCTGTYTTQVTVNPTPTIGITSSPSVVCTNGPSTLTASGAIPIRGAIP